MDYVYTTLSIVSSIITISAIWGINENSSLIIKIVLTAGAGIIVLVSFFINGLMKIVPKNYAVDQNTNDVSSIIVKKHKFLQVDTLVTIFMKDQDVIHVVAIGTVVDYYPNNMVQIDIVFYNDKDFLNRIKNNQTNIKKYYIVPRIRYTDIIDKLK